METNPPLTEEELGDIDNPAYWGLSPAAAEPLTEEELASIEESARFGVGTRDALRLIADLRASRARVKALETELQEANTRPVIRGW